MDTRTSNVPVCRFQHRRKCKYYYTILFGLVKMDFPDVKTKQRKNPG